MTQTSPRSAADGSGSMFDRIAERYDLLNKLMSFGLDKRWRRKLIASLEITGTAQVLDVATGTADVAIAIAVAHPDAQVTGLDPSQAMLDVGQRKIDAAQLESRLALTVGDAQHMSNLSDNTFAASCISFGIRNVPDRGAGLREMARVTRTGGRVSVLELAEPRSGWLAPAARFHIHSVVPRLGAWISGDAEYAYLAQSIEAFPPPDAFSELMQQSGLNVLSVEEMSFGAAHLYVATPV